MGFPLNRAVLLKVTLRVRSSPVGERFDRERNRLQDVSGVVEMEHEDGKYLRGQALSNIVEAIWSDSPPEKVRQGANFTA